MATTGDVELNSGSGDHSRDPLTPPTGTWSNTNRSHCPERGEGGGEGGGGGGGVMALQY